MPTDNGLLDRRFQLGKVLGRGPSGVVYAATDRETGKPCAVKRLHAQFYDRAVLLKVQRDAQTAAQLANPAILAAQHTGFEAGGALYLVMPAVQGESLAQRLLRGPLSLTATLALLEPLCAALQAGHEIGLHHGAITPTNVLCSNSGGVLVSDFGMCHLRSTPKVQWGGAMGYAAPETFTPDAELATARGDVFSLGALVFECLTGTRMFSATSISTFLSSVKTPPLLGTLLPKYAHLDAVLEMASTLQPDDRFANAGALWRALQSSLIDLPETVEPPPSPPPPAIKAPRAPEPRAGRQVRAMPVIQAPAEPPPSAASSGLQARVPDPLPPPPAGPSAALPVAGVDLGEADPSSPVVRPLALAMQPPASRPPPTPPPAPGGAARSRPLLPPGAGLPPGHVLPMRPPANRFDPENIIATDPSHSLRPVAAVDRGHPVLWATIGGAVVAILLLGVQWLSGSRHPTPGAPPGASVASVPLEETALLQRAQTELAQRSYAAALSYAELLLRTQPQHPQARTIVKQASEMLSASAIYGGFLRAADRSAASVAAALYRELPAGSSERTQAWEPFPQVRNQFTRSRLNIAEAASSSGACDEIRTQIDRLHWVVDSESDQALLQGQRLLGKCKNREGGGASAESPAPSGHKSVAALAPESPEPREPKSDRPHKRRRAEARPAGGELKGFPETKRSSSKPSSEPKSDESPEQLPRGLRNPFGP